MNAMAMRPDKFDVDQFLRVYWQKHPLLIRNPWQRWSNPLEPDELAGLACESDVESRLITQAPGSWDLEHGPLNHSRFGQIGTNPWTLLVQAVDHHVPAVAALLEPFRFIPNWRIDDVMVSYAVDGGGVGAHFDQYDVFLVQGMGQRRWQVGALCDETTELLPHDDLRLLADFEPSDEWILEPGDILYVPPRFTHNGVAVGDDCMTYSIGFRAPSRRELIADWSESLIADLDEDDRYVDPDLTAQDNPGEITSDTIARLQDMIAAKLLNRDAFSRWFGQYNTMPKNADIDWRPEEPIQPEDMRHLFARNTVLLRNPASRISFIRDRPPSISLFVDGECFACTGDAAAFAQRLCAQERITVSPSMIDAKAVMELVLELLNRGSLAFDPDA